MLSPALMLAVGLLAGQAPSDAAIKTFGEACVARTPVTREALAGLASAGRWQVGQAETPADLEWRDIYRDGTTIVRLAYQNRVSGENLGERICVVMVGPAPANWRDKVSALPANGAPVGPADEYDREVYRMPEGLQLTVWDLPDGSRIHALLTAENELELSINYPTGR